MRRAAVAVVIVAVLAGVVWLVWVGTLASEGALDAGPQLDPVPPRPDDAVALTVEHVYDGDTIRATAASPTTFAAEGDSVRIRLIGIDTPEGTPVVECGAEEARDHLRTLLPEGSRVWGAPDRDPQDRYGRALLYLWATDGAFLNYELVASGHAEALRVEPNVVHAELFASAEREARGSARGQWGSC